MEDFLHFFFFFFWRARVEDYPPRGFIVGGHFVSPEGAKVSPSKGLKKICLRHFHFLLLKKGFVE